MSTTRSFYDILNSHPKASFDELKANYKRLILQCHPDKLHDNNAPTATETTVAADPVALATNANAAANDNIDSEFVEIHRAWNTLKDPASRKLYDAELLSARFQTHSNVFERLRLRDLTVVECTATDDDDNDDDGYADRAGDVDNDAVRTKLYTYDCRCGGQYIVDESVDSEIFDGSHDDEVLVECSECSLVIILLNG